MSFHSISIQHFHFLNISKHLLFALKITLHSLSVMSLHLVSRRLVWKTQLRSDKSRLLHMLYEPQVDKANLVTLGVATSLLQYWGSSQILKNQISGMKIYFKFLKNKRMGWKKRFSNWNSKWRKKETLKKF